MDTNLTLQINLIKLRSTKSIVLKEYTSKNIIVIQFKDEEYNI